MGARTPAAVADRGDNLTLNTQAQLEAEPSMVHSQVEVESFSELALRLGNPRPMARSESVQLIAQGT